MVQARKIFQLNYISLKVVLSVMKKRKNSVHVHESIDQIPMTVSQTTVRLGWMVRNSPPLP